MELLKENQNIKNNFLQVCDLGFWNGDIALESLFQLIVGKYHDSQREEYEGNFLIVFSKEEEKYFRRICSEIYKDPIQSFNLVLGKYNANNQSLNAYMAMVAIGRAKRLSINIGV